MNEQRDKKMKWLHLIIAFFPVLLIELDLDNDFWFLINHGRYILHNGFTTIEPFTMHSGLKFSFGRWLTSVLYYTIYRTGGVFLMFAFLAIILFLVLLFIRKLCLVVSNDNEDVATFITFIAGWMIHFNIISRPHVFTILFVAIELYILESYVKTGNKKYLVIIPVVSLLEVNFHTAVWPIIFVYMLPYLADLRFLSWKKIKSGSYEKKPIVVAFISSIVVGILNPYGLRAFLYLPKSYGNKFVNHLVTEMQPAKINSIGVVPITLIGFFAFLLIMSDVKRLELRYVFLALGTFYLGMSANRNIYFLIIVLAMLYSFHLKDLKIQLCKVQIVLPLMTFIMIVGYFSLEMQLPKLSYDGTGFVNTAKVVDYIKQNYSDDVTMYTYYDDGSYCEYMGIKCYMDTRAEVFVKKVNGKEDIFKEFYNLQTLNLDLDEFLNKYQFDLLLISDKDKLYHLTDKINGYKKVYTDEHCILMERE